MTFMLHSHLGRTRRHLGRTRPAEQGPRRAGGANKPLPFPRRHGAAETPCHAPARLAHPRPARQSLTAGGKHHVILPIISAAPALYTQTRLPFVILAWNGLDEKLFELRGSLH